MELSKRQRILDEIYNTEVSYLNFLKICQTVYFEDMISHVPPIIPLEKTNEMFKYLDTIITISQELIRLFDESKKSNCFESEIGNIFIQMQSYLKGYNLYVANNAYALNIADRLYKKEKYAKYLETLRQSIQGPDTMKLDLNSFLIMPVQRVPRYRLLLQDLLKNTPDGTLGKSALATALEQIKVLGISINESIADEERRRKLLEIQSRLPKSLQPKFVCPGREFVMETTVVLTWEEKLTKLTLIFVTDMLIFAETVNKRIDVKYVMIIGRIKRQTGERTEFELYTKEDGNIKLVFLNEKDGQLFHDKITELIPVQVKKLAEKKAAEDECPCCRKSLNRLASYSSPGFIVCAKCNKKVCNTCATTKIALVAGGAPRKVCDACILEQFTKQQETNKKLKQKKEPLLLNSQKKDINEFQQNLITSSCTSSQVFTSPMLCSTGHNIYSTPMMTSNPYYIPLTYSTRQIPQTFTTSQPLSQTFTTSQPLSQTVNCSNQTQRSQIEILKNLNVPQRRPQTKLNKKNLN
ncbi:Rho guanine nucleotide exchange factor, putative [Entamoeba histolytica HM-1:IMSS-B]|uniref:Rho guanine nucleotide exchange factor, putative n=4 Tax=Entamoeba histolytica TaxID=5759 RepID=C4LYU6_ENTH1|nr:Rho guanine nucleotide exchange factor, putative [Entamoeba histolytica HM-1:IMSS]EAL44674.1 Rho guanine nucleotide exchange factor, putative [Entamoeba histolytica HM-1:IMSS]EMH72660.1 Rho guanine nucleotide exchange factor, putative [Entamoeba histolytica HM-1:IMSS-B]ENY64937.1 Rho guanine nucleotide exchange factor, putative [Entamoeba histolytica HM-1:IMSS-A]GAT94011.1 rho guanine nucleotide exchange factor putative [Entamoeba histolytica]|eukprot:XP_650060.1 Rho guanine nucleotide exchange factor, putative [Entamoeba histolytica HM-1:IMSS]